MNNLGSQINEIEPRHHSKSSNTETTSTENLSGEIIEAISELSEDKKQILIRALSVSKSHSGPLPDGETIKSYNEVITNGGDRLMATVEKQLEHRIEIEKISVLRSFNQSSTGQWMGFLIAICFGVIAWDLAKTGHTVVASILGTVDLVALVAVFITGKLTSNS